MEGTAGLSAQGGIVSDSSWDEEIESLDFSPASDEFVEEVEDIQTADAASLYGGEDSLESIAGVETPSPPVPEVSEAPVEAPPLPPGGLPEGWTTEQWKWYGQEWLDKNQ